MHGFDFLVFYTEHVWIFGILDKKQFGILVFWYFAQKPVSGPLQWLECGILSASALFQSGAQNSLLPSFAR
jgi:hypothetical protein